MMAPAQARRERWIDRRRFRYKKDGILPFARVRESLRTGDIILFHKTARTGLLDTLELDFVAPLFFERNEFRHSGIVVRRGDSLSVVECTEPRHSGYAHASYPTGGIGIREVPLEPLLESYTRDNGDPHFGVRHIPVEIPVAKLMSQVNALGPVGYLHARRSIPIYATSLFLPARVHARIIQRYADEMMCSEFVHSVLASCGALKPFPSKVFAPYLIENARLFARHDLVGYSDIIRFALI